MIVFLQLFYTFFKIGLFGFGGGYAMLSMIQGEVVTKHHWLSSYEFTDIVAISQMTPGPIGINSATYVGYTAVVNAGYSHVIGIVGSTIATLAVVLPSFILMILISKFFLKYQKHPTIAMVFSGLRPGVVGLLAAAALVLMNGENFGTDTKQIIISCCLFLGTFIASYRYKVNPILLICICGGLGLLTSCTGGGKSVNSTEEGDTLHMHYAQQICIIEHKDYTKAIVNNPWKEGQILHTYILIDKNQPQPSELPKGSTVIKTPLSDALVYSSVHCSLLEQLDAMKSLRGVCDLNYIHLPAVQTAYQEGNITDCGSSMNPNIETIIDLHPDGILLSPFENSGGYGRIEKLNIPIIECADYMEVSPLGRAEWMRFFGRLFGKAQQADSLFACVEKEYLSLKELAATQSTKPTVLSELKNGTAWYVPGGNSTSGQLYQDAGANYLFSHLKQSGSVSLAFEAVFDKAQHADFWLIKYNQRIDKTYDELKNDFAPYARFDAFQKRNIYGCNTNKVPFYEESPFHPEYLLKDLIKIFHPSLLNGYELKYFSKLAE